MVHPLHRPAAPARVERLSFDDTRAVARTVAMRADFAVEARAGDEMLAAASRLPLERKAPHALESSGEYRRKFQADFPFEIKRLAYEADRPNRALWHTYLEVFVLLTGSCRRQMGDQVLELRRGDLVVMDHVKLHRVMDFPGAEAEALVIRFLPEFVVNPATATADQVLLLPFQCQFEDEPHLVRADDPTAAPVQAALARLLECYAGAGPDDYRQAGSRAHFLVLLHLLASRFRASERLKPAFAQQQARNGRLQKVFEHIAVHFAEPIALPEMARKAGLSRQRFNEVMKKAAGMTLIEYVTHVRLTHATRLLQETDRTVAEIASALGFADQSYFDRRFREHFGRTPRQFRHGISAPPAWAAPAAENRPRKGGNPSMSPPPIPVP